MRSGSVTLLVLAALVDLAALLSAVAGSVVVVLVVRLVIEKIC
jgi:hypothetical protein